MLQHSIKYIKTSNLAFKDSLFWFKHVEILESNGLYDTSGKVAMKRMFVTIWRKRSVAISEGNGLSKKEKCGTFEHVVLKSGGRGGFKMD